MGYSVFISAAEPSADAHCAGLIAALKQSGCDIKFAGVGGPKMAAAGCELLENTSDKAVMAYNAFSHIAYFYNLIKRITSFLKSNKIDLVIVCDSPAFNFHIAKAAKKLGIKTVFYIAPQLWAWAEWRIRKLRKCCDKLCCILPFEQEWFATRGIDVTFVGNPLLDEMDDDLSRYRKRYIDFEPKKACIALMPGSRDAEINSLWVPMQQIAIRIKRKYPDVVFTAVAVDERRKDILKSVRVIGFKGRYEVCSVAETARRADFAIVASGSATVEAAAAGCPMVIMYQSNKIIWHLLGWWLIKTKYLSLVNILADRELVPEFMPYFSTIEPIADTVEKLLEDKEAMTQLSGELVKLAQPLKQGNASQKAAQIVVGLFSS